MRYLCTFVLFISVALAQAQLSVVSYTPADNSTGVPLATSISLTFNAALDTTYPLGSKSGIFWNIAGTPSRHYSADRKTVTFDVTLSASTVYVFCVYYARGEGGSHLQTPVGFVFTTGPSFPSYSVSGNILSGQTGVPPANTMVLLSTNPVSNGDPNPVSGAIADGNGAYVLPHVANGTYYPVAAKDVNGDGDIDPTGGDVVAIGDPVTVNNANVTGVNLTFLSFPRLSLTSAISVVDSISATLPPDKSLRYLGGWGVDSSGQSSDWEFLYLMNSGTSGYAIRVGSMQNTVEPMDSSSSWWLSNARPLTNPGSAASSATFLANVENSGGRQFRQQPPVGNLRFDCQVNLGDLSVTSFAWLVTDPSQNYWAARYSFGYDSSNYWVDVTSMNFIGNYATGAVLLVTGVKPVDGGGVPGEFSLSQNYPNPFNPSTEIRFSVPQEEWTTLKVYNLIGQEVATLVAGRVQPGSYTIRFDAGNLASGMYFYRLTAGSRALTQKMILMK